MDSAAPRKVLCIKAPESYTKPCEVVVNVKSIQTSAAKDVSQTAMKNLRRREGRQKGRLYQEVKDTPHQLDREETKRPWRTLDTNGI